MLQRSKTAWLIIGMLVLPLFLLALIGCESKSTDDAGSADGTQVNVTATPTTINIGATSVVEATVTADGEAVADQVIMFTVSPSDAGYFTPSSDTTDASGHAASVFTATSSASATLYAWMPGVDNPAEVSVTVEDTQQSGSGNVDIDVSRSLLLANGSDTASVTVTVRDELGQIATDSTVVKLTAGEKFVDIDGNGYWSQGIDSLVFDANSNGQWDGIGFIPSTALVSGGDGNVTVDYISGNDAFTVYVKATVNDNGIDGSAEASIQLASNTEVFSIYLQSDSIQLSVKGTGGIETGLIHAKAYDVNGNTVPEGLPINFYILDGPGGGEHLGTVSVGTGPYAAVTNSQGVATASIHSGTAPGTIRIRAQASDTVLSTATQVLVSAGPPVYATVCIEECNVPWWDECCDEVSVSAVVSDLWLNPVNDSMVVYFSCDEGTMKSHEGRTSDHEGIATSVWICGHNIDTATNVLPTDRGAGRVLVMAETSGGTVADTGFFYNSHFPAVLSVSGAPASMDADGEDEASVTVYAVDLNNNPVASGTSFNAEAKYLNVAAGTFEDGCYYSNARVKITSVVLKRDYSLTGGNDDGIGAVDLVEYWCKGGASITFPVTLLTATAYTPNCTFDGQTTASPLEVVSFSAIIVDRYGNPLGDNTLVMTAPDGVVTGGTQSTNEFGEATGFIWTAPNSAGSTTITITDTDPRGGVVLTKLVNVEV